MINLAQPINTGMENVSDIESRHVVANVMGDHDISEETYPNFEGKTIDGELIPTKDDMRRMNSEVYSTTNPFAKKCCADCAHLTPALNWWCSSEKAIKARGTRIPGIRFCPYWYPKWSQIPKKYRTTDYGYKYSSLHKVSRKFTAWINGLLVKFGLKQDFTMN